MISAATVNFDENTLVTGSPEGIVKIWDIGTHLTLREKLSGFEVNKARVKSLKITNNNALYALGSDGKFCNIIYRNNQAYEAFCVI